MYSMMTVFKYAQKLQAGFLATLEEQELVKHEYLSTTSLKYKFRLI